MNDTIHLLTELTHALGRPHADRWLLEVAGDHGHIESNRESLIAIGFNDSTQAKLCKLVGCPVGDYAVMLPLSLLKDALSIIGANHLSLNCDLSDDYQPLYPFEKVTGGPFGKRVAEVIRRTAGPYGLNSVQSY